MDSLPILSLSLCRVKGLSLRQLDSVSSNGLLTAIALKLTLISRLGILYMSSLSSGEKNAKDTSATPTSVVSSQSEDLTTLVGVAEVCDTSVTEATACYVSITGEEELFVQAEQEQEDQDDL